MTNATPLIAEVISIGDEMTSGDRLDTNSQWLSRELGALGIRVLYHATVGDSLQACIDVFRIAASRADIIVATGGLGPTADDLTRQAIAEAAETTLEFPAGGDGSYRTIIFDAESLNARSESHPSDVSRWEPDHRKPSRDGSGH